MTPETEVMLALIKANNDASTRLFEGLKADMKSIDDKVTSLIESRTLAVGAWKATATIAGLVSGFVSVLGVVIAWLLKH